MPYSVEIQDTGERKYCARAVIRDGTRYVGEISWTQGYGYPDEDAIKAGCISRAYMFAAAPGMLAELRKAESFISGFEDDELQEGIADLLAGIRSVIAKAGN
jgi:hypothetical protein